MLISADLKCYYCGTVAGEVVADTHQPRQVLAFLPASEAPRVTPARHCQRCGGPVYMDDVQTLSRQEAALRLRRSAALRPTAQPLAAGA